MHTGDEIPHVNKHATLRDALLEITRKNLGMTVICDESMKIDGIFTDGDLRRMFDMGGDMRQLGIAEVMTPGHSRASRYSRCRCAEFNAVPPYHLRTGC